MEREGRVWSLRVAGPGIRVLQALAQVSMQKVLLTSMSPTCWWLSEDPWSLKQPGPQSLLEEHSIPGLLQRTHPSRVVPVPVPPRGRKSKTFSQRLLTTANGSNQGFCPARRIGLIKLALSPDQDRWSLNPEKGVDKICALSTARKFVLLRFLPSNVPQQQL